MTYTRWLRDGWFIFFCGVAVLITVTLVMPAAFGLQNFTQWGGMYDDHWCQVNMYDGNPHMVGSVPKTARFAIGEGDRRVFSAPTHNYATCLASARLWCGKNHADGWIISWIEPELKGERYLGAKNVCDYPASEMDTWFIDEK